MELPQESIHSSYSALAKSLALASGCLVVLVIVFHFTVPLFYRPSTQLPAAVYPSTIVTLINSERLAHGLSILSENVLLDRAAQMKADDMVNNGYYAHVSPDGKTPLYWLNAVGYNYLNVGENLVVRVSDSNQAVDAWMNSPDHRENILRADFTQTGVAIAQGQYEGKTTYYVVQIFATPYPHAVSLPRAVTTVHAATTQTKMAPVVAQKILEKKVAVPKVVTKTPTGPQSEATTSAATPDSTAATSSIAAASSTESAPTVSVDNTEPVALTTSSANAAGDTDFGLLGKEELLTRPETAPSEPKNSLQLFVYFAGAGISDLFSN